MIKIILINIKITILFTIKSHVVNIYNKIPTTWDVDVKNKTLHLNR